MPRETLTQDQIVLTAIEVLDQEGIDGLSMRRLGTRLGAAATAMYWHVAGRDELIGLAADAVWGEIELPEHAAGWRDAVETMAHGLLRMIARHPWLIPAMSSHLRYGPGKARHDDHLLGIFETAHFSPREADRAAAAVVSCTLGLAVGAAADAAWRTRQRRNGADEQRELDAVNSAIRSVAERYPRLHARIDALDVPDRPEADLRDSLTIVLDGIEAGLSGRADHHGSPRSRTL